MTWGPSEPIEVSAAFTEENQHDSKANSGDSLLKPILSLAIAGVSVTTVAFLKYSSSKGVCSELSVIPLNSCTLFGGLLALLIVSTILVWKHVQSMMVFFYVCFLKGISGTDQSERLESFYKNQASVYDETRKKLLGGREDMLRVSAGHLLKQIHATGENDLIWVDIGGGTGWNVERMNEYFPIKKFSKVYIVDLCASLCKTSEKRFRELGWDNVHVVCTDATRFTIPEGESSASLVTFSYSLSMIPNLYSTIDNAYSLLKTSGFIGVVDFGVSSKVDAEYRRHSWLSRWFWQLWFDFDYITLHHSQRQYVEHKFNMIKDFTGWNYFILGIPLPYFILVGTKNASQEFTVQEEWRMSYDDSKRNPWDTYMYAFSWEDPEVDLEVLDLKPEDRMLAITSGGCNLLRYIKEGLTHVSAVDMNACQNHLFELKLAALKSTSTDYSEFWQLFGEGRCDNFSEILDLHLSPYLSMPAYRFWKERVSHFTKTGLYYTGHSGSGLKMVRFMYTVLGIRKEIEQFCHSRSLDEVSSLWTNVIRPRMFPSWLVNMIFKRSKFMWGVLGVPKKQMKLLLDEYDGDLRECIADTFEPIAARGVLPNKNYFYYCGLMGNYHPECCPKYLEQDSFNALSQDNAQKLDSVRVYTKKFVEVLRCKGPDGKGFTKVILMDHMDWFNQIQAQEEIDALWDAVLPGGQVFWRSAERKPWYCKLFEETGFKVEEISSRKSRDYLDRVNMYLCFYKATKPIQ